MAEISGEMMHQLVRGEWSAPVQLQARHLGHGRFELTARTVDTRLP